jgi:hypothetical protein
MQFGSDAKSNNTDIAGFRKKSSIACIGHGWASAVYATGQPSRAPIGPSRASTVYDAGRPGGAPIWLGRASVV